MQVRKTLAVMVALAVTATATVPGGVVVTASDVETVKAKLNQAIPFFNRVWSQMFAQRGLSYSAPAAYAYSGTVDTPCGRLEPGNGMYCSKNNTIYLDAGFLATLMKGAARQLGTDGDYAAIVVAAHEFGHLMQHELGTVQNWTFLEEQAADCFAGAVTREAKIAGALDPGDLEEGRYSMASGGDMNGVGPLAHVLGRMRAGAHGDAMDRLAAFNRGYYVGAQTCSAALGSATVPAAGRTLFQSGLAGLRPQDGGCAVTSGTGELVVTNPAGNGTNPCSVWAVSFSPLPDNFRMEVTVRHLQGDTQAEEGIAFGRQWGDQAGQINFAGTVKAAGGWSVFNMASPTVRMEYLASFSPTPTPLSRLIATGYGTSTRLTIDVHREQSQAAILLYVNGRYAGAAEGSFGWLNRSQRNELVRLYLGQPGTSAAFRDLTVSALEN